MPITLDGTLGVGTPGITLAGGAITANANQLNSSAEDVNAENRIINGDFGIWQRGTSGTTNGYTAADRWLNNHVGGTVTQSQQPLSPGDNLGTAGLNPTFLLRENVTGQTLPAQYAQVQQRIESVRSYAGQTITILGWARRSSGATGNMAVEVSQFFGTGGGASIEVLLAPVTVTLGASWAPFAVTIAVPSIVGKTIGTSVSDCLALRFWISAGSDWNARTNSLGLQTIAVDFWGIHIRVGTWTAADAALYRPRDPGTERALCLRYYQRWDLSASLGTLGANGLVATKYSTADPMVANYPLMAPMRAAPLLNVTPTTARFVCTGGTPTVTVGSYATDGTRPITMMYYNGAVAPSYGWLDTIGVVSADAEL